MVGVDPSALGHVLLLGLAVGLVPVLLLELAGGLDAVVPSLAAAVADVAGPDAALGLVVLLDGDPGDAGRVVVVGDGDVAAAAAGDVLVYCLFADSAALDFAAVGLAAVAVALVEAVDLIDRASLWSCQLICSFRDLQDETLPGLQLRPSVQGDQLLVQVSVIRGCIETWRVSRLVSYP